MKLLSNAPPFSNSPLEKYIKLILDRDLNKTLNEINEEYPYWDSIKYRSPFYDLTIDEIWHIIKFKRRASYETLKFGNHHFAWNVNNKILEYLHYLDLNIGGQIESSAIISKEDKNRYLISSLMEEAIASSQIEGAVTTRKVAKEMLRKNQKPRNKSEQMILNNYVTIQKILEIKSQPLNSKNLLMLHKLITNGTMYDAAEEGIFRQDNDVNVIDTDTGNIIHHPPDHEEIESILDDVYTFFNEDSDSFIHPLIKGSIIHFMVGYLHPFSDGNGRTARALFYWYLLKKGYWLTEYLSISRLILRSKAQYARAYQYTEIDDHDLTYFIFFKLKIMVQSFEELKQYIKRKNEEKMTVTNFIKAGKISYKQALILEWFKREPNLLLTAKETETRLALSIVGARKNLTSLVENGYLVILELDKKTHAFIRSENFDNLISG